MQLPYHKKVSFRLTRMAVGATIVFGIVLTVVLAAFGYADERGAVRSNVAALLRVSADAAGRALERGDAAGTEAVVAGLLQHDYIVTARVEDASGAVLADGERAGAAPYLDWFGVLFGERRDRRERALAGGGGKIVVDVALNRALLPFQHEVIYFLIFGIASALVLAGVIKLSFERVLERPLIEIIERFQQIDPTRPGQARLPVVAGHEEDELGVLTAVANNFLQVSRDYLAERKWAEEDLKDRERRLQNVAENIPGIVFQQARYPDGRFAFTFLSSGIRLLHGLDPEKVVEEKRDLLEVVHPDDREQYIAALNDSARRLRPLNMEVRHLSRDGGTLWVHINSRPYRTDTGIVLWDGVALDVTDRKQAQERIQYLAQYDPLTGLLNRVWFIEYLKRQIEVARRSGDKLAVLFLDLDDFKSVNDTLGHDIGDLLLKAVADRLQKRMRKSDTVTRYGTATVSRLGGDEFTIVLNNLKKVDGAATAAQRIIEAVGETFHIEGNEIRSGTSIGIAVFPEDGDSADQLLKNADLAMYQSKADKLQKYHFYVPEMNAEVIARKALEVDLRTAIDQGQLWLAYQAQVEVCTGRIVGCEALLRWNHPERGAVSPVDIIPTAEHTNLIIPIGEWAFHEACRQNKAWQDADLPPIAVTVNVSAVQIEYQDVVALVERALSESGLDARYLHVEVTESVVIRHHKTALKTLHGLREMGVKVYLDDFGTGYSSLSYLRRFPIDTIKIDRAFIRDVTVNPDDAGITQAIISMAHTLKMKVTAEGVETEAQLVFLRNENCDAVQGHYFSKPVAPEEFAKLLALGTFAVPFTATLQAG